MMAYAQWLAQHPDAWIAGPIDGPSRQQTFRGPPKTCERTAKASKEARRPITRDLVVALERRPDFITYFQKLRADYQFMAKELLKQDISRNIELRREGLESAAKNEDHKAIKGYTDWVTGVAFPKKVIEEGHRPTIHITIGGGSEARALLGKVLSGEQVEDGEYEIVEPKQLNPGEEED
jgi:hypothetical protein